jgi:uncharacterized repeat protein (TIGR03803 family)
MRSFQTKVYSALLICLITTCPLVSLALNAPVVIGGTTGLTVIHSFNSTAGDETIPNGLVLGNNGNFYGTTVYGGSKDDGTVYKITPYGNFSTLYNFTLNSGNNGGCPHAALVLGSDGNFYGTTALGGNYNHGTVFKMTPAGSLKGLSSLDGYYSYDNSNTPSALIEGSDGCFYGTTPMGGINGIGMVYKVSKIGSYNTVYSLGNGSGNTNDGANPGAKLISGGDGNFYGTTFYGGSNGSGTVFKVNPNGVYAVIHDFNSTDGNHPNGLMLGSDGCFYGTTSWGGVTGYGTVFKLTSTGSLTTLHSFNYNTEGANPSSKLIQTGDGCFYGSAAGGGPGGNGVIFRVNADATLTLLHYFGGADGAIPASDLVQWLDGSILGTTNFGGSNANGTVFRLMPKAVVGQPFSYQITASNSPSSYSAKGLPLGMAVNPLTGLISGIPTTAGTVSSTISATNARGTGNAVLKFNILPPAPVLTGSLTVIGTPEIQFKYLITASNLPAVYAADGLPQGLNINTTTGVISGAPWSTGTSLVTIAASNAGGTSEATLVLKIIKPYDFWKNQKFSTEELANPAISGDTASTSDDGIPNLMRYALNLDPKIHIVTGLPVSGTTTSSGKTFLTLTYKQPALASDISYVTEVSGNMTTWNSGPGFTTIDYISYTFDGTATITVRDLVSIQDSGRRFIRLKVMKD